MHDALVYSDRYLASMNNPRPGCTMSIKSLLASTCFRTCGRRHGNYLTMFYLVSKVLFIANVIIQLFALNFFLGHQFSMYGIHVAQSLLAGEDWTASPRFPRVTMCDFNVRRLGNVHRYTVQCVLPINLFNEKIYLFVWFWMIFVAAASCFSLFKWTLRAMFARDGRLYVKKHLKMIHDMSGESEKRRLTSFVDKYLKADGVFVLRLLAHNTNTITATEFISSLWDYYKSKSAPKMGDDDEAIM